MRGDGVFFNFKVEGMAEMHNLISLPQSLKL